jgi:hypothetical protein
MFNPGRPAATELNRLVSEGIAADIYLAHEAHGIFKTIGENVAAAEASTYQPMLVALQSYASAELVLAITRLLERQGQRYELHSVHGTLMYLRDHAADIPIREPIFLQQAMERLGLRNQVPHEAGEKQTLAVVDALVSTLPHHTNSTALKALKDLRDKRIAHPERAKPEGIETTTWDEALKLLRIPTEALAVFGAYTSTAYVDNEGRLFVETDAARAGVATSRILALPVTGRPAK